jgi:regulator of sirC expression with transglutaminase-like and TPR domain
MTTKTKNEATMNIDTAALQPSQRHRKLIAIITRELGFCPSRAVGYGSRVLYLTPVPVGSRQDFIVHD